MCNKFESIQENALKIPKNIDEIAEVLQHVGLTKEEHLPKLNENIQVK